MIRTGISGLALVAVATMTVVAGDIQMSKVDLSGVACVVASRDAQASKSADFKDAKVYFCCNGCSGKFAKAPKKYTLQANRQLVQTKQYTQTGCPFSGGDVDPEVTESVAGVKVAFCCTGCQGKVASADDKEKLKLVFSEKAFKKAFAKTPVDED